MTPDCEVCGQPIDGECACTDCPCATCTGGNCRCQADFADRLVESASKPNLGQLIKQGRASGVIKPLKSYGG